MLVCPHQPGTCWHTCDWFVDEPHQTENVGSGEPQPWGEGLPAPAAVMTCLFYTVSSDVAVKCKLLNWKRENSFFPPHCVFAALSVWRYVIISLLSCMEIWLESPVLWFCFPYWLVTLAKHRLLGACLVKHWIQLSFVVLGSCFDLVCLAKDPQSVCFLF